MSCHNIVTRDLRALKGAVGHLDPADLVGVTTAMGISRHHELRWAFEGAGAVRHFGQWNTVFCEWRKLLTPDQFAVLRMSATERPFTSALLHEKRRGNFACAGCDLDLFSATTKYDSGTG